MLQIYYFFPHRGKNGLSVITRERKLRRMVGPFHILALKHRAHSTAICTQPVEQAQSNFVTLPWKPLLSGPSSKLFV